MSAEMLLPSELLKSKGDRLRSSVYTGLSTDEPENQRRLDDLVEVPRRYGPFKRQFDR